MHRKSSSARMPGYAGVARALRRYHRLIHGDDGGDAPVWFRLSPPHPDLWGDSPVEPVILDDRMRRRLSEGLRLSGPDSTSDGGVLYAVGPAPRPCSTVERSYAGMASLLRQPTFCLAGVPAAAADRVPWAAAGCGLIADRLDALPPGARLCPPARTVSAAALPGWMIGTDVYGAPVVIHLPPGSTVLLRGPTAPAVASTIPPSGRVVGQDVVTTTPTTWAESWHPQRCRLVVDDSPGTGDTTTALTGSAVDMVVDLEAGTVSTRGSSRSFSALPLRYPARS